MNKMKSLVLTLSIAISGIAFALPLSVMSVFSVAPASTVSALDVFPDCKGDEPEGTICNNRDPNEFGDFINTIVKTLFFVLGAVSVVVIVISGFRYVISQGDPKAVSAAKDTLLYAVIGLIVALMAYAVVNFVGGIVPK